MSSRGAIVAVALLAGACGGAAGSRPAAKSAPAARTPVKREALRDFDAGLRAVRLGGPEATERAIGRFEAAVKHDPTLWEAWYDLGVLYAREGDDDAALDALDEAHAKNPSHASTL